MRCDPRLSLTAIAAAALLAACGGGDTAITPAPAAPAGAPPAPTARTLSGTVAVGAPITGGTLRILDAAGAVVASNVTVDADGRYADVALTGTGPWRIEACGHAGANYVCVYSVASAAGTANATPLTTATMLLATGQSPDALMAGNGAALTADAVASAQAQLRTGLASVIAGAGAASNIDFISGTLTAGSRSGYDGVLDAVGVSLGQDGTPFVQITPRLGDGNLYLQQGSSSGTVTAASGVDALQLGGLETLFKDMSDSLASAAACSSGLQRSMASNARMAVGDAPATGAAAVAADLCGFFAGGEDGSTPMWGARLMSPVLGRCDLSGAAPVCAVSFTLRDTGGAVQPVGNGMAVTKQAGVWKFMGDMFPVSIQASAKTQRTVRVDSAIPVVDYDRAFAFEVGALPGIACAKVSQHDASGANVTLGYYKRHAGAPDQRSLSLWTTDGYGNRASTDPLAGATRSGDDTWIALPQGSDGDAVIRNFYRAGRSVTVSLYADAGCTTAFAVEGRSSYDVEVQGVPPVWSAMDSLPWPSLDDATKAALRTLALPAGATANLAAAWSYPRGPMGVDGATVCASRAECGEGGSGRLGERAIRPGATSATVALRNHGTALEAADPKTLALYGRNGESVDMQSNFSACPRTPAGETCRD